MSPSNRSIVVPRWSPTPCERSDRSTTSVIIGSSDASTRFCISTTWTSVPSAANAVAISIAIAPPPMISSFDGGDSSSNNSSFVTTRSAASPSTSIVSGFDPPAITTCSARTMCVVSPSSTLTTCGSRDAVSDAHPRTRWMRWCSAISTSSRRARSSRFGSRPREWIVDASRAACNNAFEGMHPTLVQSPPIWAPSISTTSWPKPASPMARVRPPDPAPMTAALYVRVAS